MKLSQLLSGAVPNATALPDLDVTGLECRAAHLQPGQVYFAIDEYLRYNIWCHGADDIATAIACGASAIVRAPDAPTLVGAPAPAPIPVIHVADPRLAFGRAARNFHRVPDARVPVVAVTGTNGKTTTVRLIEHLFAAVAGAGGSTGTLGVFLSGAKIGGSDYTTDLAHENFRRLRALVDAGARGIAMEVSSHALALDRVAGLQFAAAVVTNVTRDHLDFHGTDEAYRAAKLRLIEMLPPGVPAVLNRDMDCYAAFARAADAVGARCLSYGTETDTGAGADVRASAIDCRIDGSRFTIDGAFGRHNVHTRLLGRFQVYNTLAAFTACAALGLNPAALAAALADFQPAPGRMETVPLPRGVMAVVDYAHNPDGLRNLLENCRALKVRRLLVVFGCGGDRDRGKRPIMGGIATAIADHTWITSDNPRTEDPDAIIADIVAGCAPGANFTTITDRTAAILAAYAAATEGDLLVVAGKGHEDYIIVGHDKIPYSDLSVLARCAAG